MEIEILVIGHVLNIVDGFRQSLFESIVVNKDSMVVE